MTKNKQQDIKKVIRNNEIDTGTLKPVKGEPIIFKYLL